MNEENNTPEGKMLFKEECGLTIFTDPFTRISISDKKYVLIRGVDGETNKPCTLVLGDDPQALIALVQYMSHLIIDHHGIDLAKLMGGEVDDAPVTAQDHSGHIH